jgi:hypothetical protein
MERIHYTESDTDSMFLSIAGSLKEDYHQTFKNVILNKKFYNENVYSWLPTPAARVRSRVWLSGICGEQSGAGAGFLRVLRFFLPIFIPPNSPSS